MRPIGREGGDESAQRGRSLIYARTEAFLRFEILTTTAVANDGGSGDYI